MNDLNDEIYLGNACLRQLSAIKNKKISPLIYPSDHEQQTFFETKNHLDAYQNDADN